MDAPGLIEEIPAFLAQIEARLPELEWKLNLLDGGRLDIRKLPRPLFPFKIYVSVEDCMQLIKQDLLRLRESTEVQTIYYLAVLLQEKISILVQICRLTPMHSKAWLNFDLNKISTRKEWLLELEADRHDLLRQKSALLERLAVLRLTQENQAETKILADLNLLEAALFKLSTIDDSLA